MATTILKNIKEAPKGKASQHLINSIKYIMNPDKTGGLWVGSNSGVTPDEIYDCMMNTKKEYGKDVLELPKLVNEEYKEKRFYIIDDIYATGNTMKSIKHAIEDLGGIVVGQGVIMNIVELNDDNNIFSLLDINEGETEC